jgi:hypothetical protein
MPFTFRFPQDTFAFENYVNENSAPPFTAVNLTDAEMLRMFGPDVCAEPDAGACVLTPQARQWMNTTSGEMANGHCEGMAVLSALFATGMVNPQSFGGANGIDLMLPNNVPLQREIGYWWALQGTEPTISAERRNQRTPVQILSDLAAGLDAGQAFTFGLFKRDGKGGHANTPYAIEPEDGGIVRILLYENNTPNLVRSLEIDVNANTWRYEATPNPQTPSEIYDGDAVTKNLSIVPISARLQPAVCPFCGSVAPDGMTVRGAAVSYRELQLTGGGVLTVTTPTGSIFRNDAGVWVNTVAGATLGESRSAPPSTWDDEVDPIFRMPLSQALTVTLSGEGLTAPEQAFVSVTGPGHSFSVEGISLDPMQVDTLVFAAGPAALTYTTTGMETPVVELGVTLDGDDYLFRVIGAAEAGGVTVRLRNDVPNGKLIVDVDAADGMAGYGIEVLRLDENETTFTHLANTVAASATVFVNYRSWPGQGSPMLFETDVNGDGVPDMSAMVADDN